MSEALWSPYDVPENERGGLSTLTVGADYLAHPTVTDLRPGGRLSTRDPLMGKVDRVHVFLEKKTLWLHAIGAAVRLRGLWFYVWPSTGNRQSQVARVAPGWMGAPQSAPALECMRLRRAMSSIAVRFLEDSPGAEFTHDILELRRSRPTRWVVIDEPAPLSEAVRYVKDSFSGPAYSVHCQKRLDRESYRKTGRSYESHKAFVREQSARVFLEELREKEMFERARKRFEADAAKQLRRRIRVKTDSSDTFFETAAAAEALTKHVIK